MSQPEQREEEVFEAAIQLPADQRAAYLDQTCAENPETRRRIEALLGAFERAGGFLKQPVMPSSPRTMAVSLTPTEKPGDKIGRYKLLQQIGEGGCGVVYMAEQEEPVRRRVALKVIKLGMDTKEVIARFEAERQALALMDHPNIAKVLDAGATETGRPYFVMELVRGIKITDYCDEHKLSTADRLKLFVQVCQAIQHAHQKGIIHRDIKPSNILVTINDGVPVPKVIDFGIAKATQGRLTDQTLFTAFEQFMGTPAYMSPEQAVMTSLDIDTRSDIYSLGVLLYELLTGRTPFDQKELLAAGLDAMRRTIREVEPVKPSTRLTLDRLAAYSAASGQAQIRDPKFEINQDLDWIAMKCLEKDRMRRYETASGLAADLQRHLNNEPVVARPPSNLYRFRKLVRRNKLAFAAAAAVMTMLVLGAAVSTWQAVRATHAERTQTRLRTEAEKARQTAQSEANRAEAAVVDLKLTLSASDFLQAAALIENENAMDALPFLARSLSANPTNDAALTRLTTLLTYRSWMQPVSTLKLNDDVTSAEFGPDGRQIVTVSDETMRVWDTETGRPLTEPMKHDTNVLSASFSSDGKRIITTSKDNAASIWSVQTGELLMGPLKLTTRLCSAEFSPDGRRIVTGTSTKDFLVWDAETGELILGPRRLVAQRPAQPPEKPAAVTNGKEAPPSKAGGTVYSMNVVGYVNTPNNPTFTFSIIPWGAHFSPDGRSIVTILEQMKASDPFGVQIWDAQSGQALTPSLKHLAPVYKPGFSPDGTRIVTPSADRTARVWDVQTGQPVGDPMKHDNTVFSASFSSDGRRIVTASDDNTARIWDAQTGRPLVDPIKHLSPVNSARFSPDGTRIVTTCRDRTTRIWEARTGRPLTAPVKNGLRSSEFSPDGKRIVTASEGNTVCVWDVQMGPLLVEPLRHRDSIHSVQFSPDGKRVVTASRSAVVWDAQTGRPITEPMRHDSAIGSAQFSPDGQRIVTGSDDLTARVWDIQTAQPLGEPMKHGKGVRYAEFSPDGRRIVTASADKTARIWDAQTGQPITEFLDHDGRVSSAHYSPDGSLFVTATDTGRVRVWDANTGQPLFDPVRHYQVDTSAQFTPDGKRILSTPSSARIWDAQTGRLIAEPIKFRDSMRAVDFSPDGRQVVTASSDFTARVWDAETGRPQTGPMRHKSGGVSARFSPDGMRIVTVCQDWTARVWDARTGQPLSDPFEHGGINLKMKWSPDGKQIAGAGANFAKVFDVAPTGMACPPWLLTLTEAISGQVLNQQSALEPSRLNGFETLNQLREQLRQEPDDEWAVWGRWFLADRATRSISPFSKNTVPEYIENRIKENTRQSLDEAEQLAAGKPELSQRISEARQALKEPRK